MDKEEFFSQYDSLNPKHQKAFAIAIVSFTRAVWNLGEKYGADCLEK